MTLTAQYPQWLWKMPSLLVFLLVLGCGTSDPNPFYSGHFVVKSDYSSTIRITEWTNFGWAQPARGMTGKASEAVSIFSKQGMIPAETTVKWVVEGRDELHSQKINLQSVVPPNAEGTIEFLIDTKGVWHVTFVPDK